MVLWDHTGTCDYRKTNLPPTAPLFLQHTTQNTLNNNIKSHENTTKHKSKNKSKQFRAICNHCDYIASNCLEKKISADRKKGLVFFFAAAERIDHQDKLSCWQIRSPGSWRRPTTIEGVGFLSH